MLYSRKQLNITVVNGITIPKKNNFLFGYIRYILEPFGPRQWIIEEAAFL